MVSLLTYLQGSLTSGIPTIPADSLPPSMAILLFLSVIILQLLNFYLRYREGDKTALVAGILSELKKQHDYQGLKADDMDEKLDKLITMHEHADDYHFGTKQTNRLLTEQVRAVTKLTEVLCEFIQQIKIERVRNTPTGRKGTDSFGG